MYQGGRVRVPAPWWFVVHRLLLTQGWRRAEKRGEDLRPAAAVGRFVLSGPEEVPG